ncbi:glycosyltransferase [Lacrimispora xylanolytica]|uniref:Glycosyltransferase n=1 Tax=Lacrimispora xylanolytica TaxID=29375 RepID=A0ABY7ACX5_9FIRM|nr:glycosyltransferase [Lacrimispora xylanolytica]WAJ24545.1 glycosyltransferase [Lacrimispora xylanolytica]
MIRVLHFVSTPAIWSGVMSVIMNYYRHIDRTLIQFDFLCFSQCEDSYADEIASYGGRIYYVKKPGSSIEAMIEMNAFFKKNKGQYQWLHNHEVYLSLYLWKLAEHHNFGNFVIHSHTTRYSDNWLNARRNQLLCYPIALMRSNKIACSIAAGEFLYGKRMVQQNKVFVLYNAIDCQKYRFNHDKRAEIRSSLSIQDKLVVGHVGRFEKQKNHDFLIESFYFLKKQYSKSVLLLIGSGRLKLTMQQKVKALGLEGDVFFLGQQNDIQDWYQAMDLFWLPSTYEGLPMAAVEAQASGLPCFLADTITKEVELLDTTKHLTLKKGPEFWALEAREKVNIIKREDAWRKVENAGFGIERASVALQRYYLNEGVK